MNERLDNDAERLKVLGGWLVLYTTNQRRYEIAAQLRDIAAEIKTWKI